MTDHPDPDLDPAPAPAPTPDANPGANIAEHAHEHTPVRDLGDPGRELGEPGRELGEPGRELGEPGRELGEPGRELGELEDERDFLLASLRDLEREHEAGDLDDADYAALRDDYTARAARVLRAIEAGQAATAVEEPEPPRGRGRAVAAGALVLLFAVVAGLLVARSAGRRDPGEVATGGVRQSTTERLNEAGRLLGSDLDAAIDAYDDVLADDPDNVEALTYKGWALTLSGQSAEGLQTLIEAATTNPRYPDVHAFLAIVFFRGGLVDEASREIARLDALDPPAQVRQLTEGLRQQIAAAQASTSTTAPG